MSTICLLYERLLARGHSAKNLKPVFTCASERIELKSKSNWNLLDKNTEDKNRIFLHWPYHPKDVSRQQIRDSYESTCESPNYDGESFKRMNNANGEVFMISRPTVAYSRPTNLRDMLSPTKLIETDRANVHSALLCEN